MLSVMLNRTTVYNQNVLRDAIDKKPRTIPLLTVSNHHSCFDDPGIWGNYRIIFRFFSFIQQSLNYLTGILPLRQICNHNITRWSLAAHDICFTNKYHSLFFMFGKCSIRLCYSFAYKYCISTLHREMYSLCTWRWRLSAGR